MFESRLDPKFFYHFLHFFLFYIIPFPLVIFSSSFPMAASHSAPLTIYSRRSSIKIRATEHSS